MAAFKIRDILWLTLVVALSVFAYTKEAENKRLSILIRDRDEEIKAQKETVRLQRSMIPKKDDGKNYDPFEGYLE